MTAPSSLVETRGVVTAPDDGAGAGDRSPGKAAPTSRRGRWAERSGLFGLVLLCVGIFFSVVAPTLAAAVAWVSRILRVGDVPADDGRQVRRRRQLYLPAVLFVLASAASALLSEAPRASLVLVGKEAFALGLIVLGVQATTLRQVRAPIAIVLTMSAIIGAWAVVQWQYEYGGVSRVLTEGGLEVYRRAHGFWHEHAGVSYGNVQAMLVGLGLGVIVAGPRSWRTPAIVAVLLALVGIALSFTRASWLVVCGLVGIVAVARRAVAVLVVAAAIVLGVLLCPWENALTARARSALDLTAPVNLDRLVRYEVGLAVVRDHPFTGTGPGVLERIYSRYARPGAEENWHLHNTYLQLLAERGPLALGAWLAMVALGAVAALRDTRGADRERRGVGVGIALILVSVLGSSVFNYTWEDWRVRGLALVFLGLAWSPALGRSRGADHAQDEAAEATVAASRHRVLFCVMDYFPTAVGGAERQARLQAVTLARRGHDVVVVAPRRRGTASGPVDDVRVVRLPCVDRRPFRTASYLVSLSVFLLANLHRFDLVHVHLAYLQADVVVGLARLLGRPVYVKVAAAGPRGDMSQVKRVAWATRYLGLRRATRIQVLSDEIRHELDEIGIEPGRIVQIPNGVDVSQFHPVDADARRRLRIRLELPLDDPVVLFVGRLARHKGVDDLAFAWRRRESAHGVLVLVGSAVTYDSAGDIAPAPDLLVRGWTDRVVDYLQAADVMVLPSYAEGMSNALLEGMACGLAVIATKVAAAESMIVHGESGLLVPPGDRDALARALDVVLRDPDLRTRLGAASAARVRARYRIEHVVDEIERVYRSMRVSS